MQNHCIKYGSERVIISVDIEKETRLLRLPQPVKRHHFRKLFQRSDAARQRNKSIRKSDHRLFPLRHCLRLITFAKIIPDLRRCCKEMRNDSDCLAAAVQHCLRNRAHQAVAAGPVDQRMTVFGNPSAKRPCLRREGWIISRGSAAIDCDLHSCSFPSPAARIFSLVMSSRAVLNFRKYGENCTCSLP